MGFIVAVKAFCGALANKETSALLEKVLNGEALLKQSESIENLRSETADKRIDSGRSEALELLATLQREARFIDFIMEPLDEIEDAAVGAAARTVHDRCSGVLERCFEIRKLADVQEGESVTLSAEIAGNRARFQLTSGIKKDSTVSGRVVHAGWIAQKCSTPQWRGLKNDELVLAPTVIEN